MIVLTIACGLAFIYSGLFNVSAKETDFPLLSWVLITTRIHSVEEHSRGIKVPSNLQDPKVIKKGFDLYMGSCSECHRAPGFPQSPLSKGLHPPPPDFSKMEKWKMTPEEIFWIIDNGIRMTGMPSFGKSFDDEQIWSLVAFLRTLPGISIKEFNALQ